MFSRTCLNRCKSLLLNNTNLSGPQHCRSVCVSAKKYQTQWTQAVSNAEKVVGYPTSFLGLRCLMSDEISNIAVYLKKLIGTGHPLLATAKKLVYSQDKVHQTRGLLVLLVSKASNSKTSDILPSQRSLAEITELVHTAHLIHSGVVNLTSPNNNLEQGNKMAILCGDFLLAHACVSLAALKNVQVVELISQAIADISTAEFIVNETPSEGESGLLNGWTQQANLRYGTLLAHACQSSLILGQHPDLVPCGGSFGREIALAWQANTDLQSYKNTLVKDRDKLPLSQWFPSGVDLSRVVSQLEKVRNHHVDGAFRALSTFPNNDATIALKNIALALKC